MEKNYKSNQSLTVQFSFSSSWLGNEPNELANKSSVVGWRAKPRRSNCKRSLIYWSLIKGKWNVTIHEHSSVTHGESASTVESFISPTNLFSGSESNFRLWLRFCWVTVIELSLRLTGRGQREIAKKAAGGCPRDQCQHNLIWVE